VKTIKVDKTKRVRLRDAKPGQVLSYVFNGLGTFQLTQVEEAPAPLVRARKVNGRWMGDLSVKPDRNAVVDSIREDRERR
jgi:hypothetical protein